MGRRSKSKCQPPNMGGHSPCMYWRLLMFVSNHAASNDHAAVCSVRTATAFAAVGRWWCQCCLATGRQWPGVRGQHMSPCFCMVGQWALVKAPATFCQVRPLAHDLKAYSNTINSQVSQGSCTALLKNGQGSEVYCGKVLRKGHACVQGEQWHF